MKKKILSLLALSAIVIGGCTKSEIDEGTINPSNAISFETSSNKLTKGAVVDNTTVINYDFGVYAYKTGEDSWSSSSTKTEFMINQLVEYTGSEWTYSPTKYWSANADNKISFFGYMPMNEGGKDTDIAATTASVGSDYLPVIAYEQVMDAEKMSDFVVGKALDKTKAESSVVIPFNHVLTRLNFSAKTDKAMNGSAVYISDLKIIQSKSAALYKSGTYTLAADATNGAWSNEIVADSDLDVSPILNKTDNNLGEPATVIAAAKISSTTATSILAEDQYLFLIPPYGTTGIKDENDICVELTYEIISYDANSSNANKLFRESYTKELSLPVGSLQEGKAYNAVITIGLDDVVLSANAIDWTEENINTVPTDITVNSATDVLTTIESAFANKIKEFTLNYTGDEGALNIDLSAVTKNLAMNLIINMPKQKDALSITIPNGYTGNVSIYAPNATVTANAPSGTEYTNLTVHTAPQTLIIPEGVTVNGLTINSGNVTVSGTLTGNVTAGEDLNSSIITVMNSGSIEGITIDDNTKIIINSTNNITNGVYFSLDGGMWTEYTGMNADDYGDTATANVVNSPQVNGTTPYKSIKIRTFGTSKLHRGMLHAVYANTELTHVDLSEAEFASTTFWVANTAGNTKLEEFIFPSNVIELNSGCSYVSTLKRVVLNDAIEKINGGAFRSCTSLTEIVNLDKVKIITGNWSGSFQDCTSLTSVDLSSLEEVVDTEREDGSICWSQTFSGCTNLKEVILSDKLTTIGCGMFRGCTSLESIDLKNVVNINTCAFESCTSLTDVNLSKVETYGEAPFRYSALGNDVAKTLNTSLEEIPTYMFSAWKNLTEYEIPANIKRIAPIAFSYTSIVDVHIPATVEEITGISIFYILPSVLDARLTITIDPDCPIKYWPVQTFNNNNYKEIDFPVATEELGGFVLNNNKYLSKIIMRNPNMVVKCIEEKTFGSITDDGINLLVGNQCASGTEKVLYVPSDLIDDYTAETITVDEVEYPNQWKTVLIDQCGFVVKSLSKLED